MEQHLVIAAFWANAESPGELNDATAEALREKLKAFDKAGSVVTFRESMVDGRFREYLRMLDLGEVGDATVQN